MVCTAMMVALDSTGSEVYLPIEMDIMDGVLPGNNTKDIMRVVSICNDVKGIVYEGATDEDVKFIDMYGLLANDKLELWENIKNEV